jgi:hypothetical protein
VGGIGCGVGIGYGFGAGLMVRPAALESLQTSAENLIGTSTIVFDREKTKYVIYIFEAALVPTDGDRPCDPSGAARERIGIPNDSRKEAAGIANPHSAAGSWVSLVSPYDSVLVEVSPFHS